jgi:hypothetical protein
MTYDIRASRGGKPCKGCPDRYPACSGHCQKPEFLAHQAEQERIKAAKKAYRPPAWTWPESSKKGFAQGRSNQ